MQMPLLRGACVRSVILTSEMSSRDFPVFRSIATQRRCQWQLSRLLEAHELIIREVREAARQVAAAGDDGTNDLLVSDILRTHEMQVWFLAEHLVDTPLVQAE